MPAATSKAPAPQMPQVMKGGAKAYVMDLAKKFSNPIHVYVLVALIVAITFVKEIPIKIRSQAGTLLGRLFLFCLTVAIGELYSWTNGLLMAVLALLLLSLSPRNSVEGFQPMSPTSFKLIEDNKKWFVERVLKENPVAIEEDRVKTQAIQETTNSSRSTVGQGTSNK
jgi:hypothetical protein